MKLYKYLHPNRIDVLKNRAIRFSPPNAFNDPFEFKPVIGGLASDAYIDAYMAENFDSIVESELSNLPKHIRSQIPKSKFQELVKLYIKNNSEVFNAVMHKAKEHVSAALTEKSNELIGVLSLTEKADNLLMWSHYAESHSGYCIGFKSNHSFFNRKRSEKDEFYHLRKVQYLPYRPSKLMVDMNGTDMFLLKSNIWEYEQEWRMCAVLPEADMIINTIDPAVHLFNFPADLIEEVIIGVNAKASLIEAILRTIGENAELSHVKVKQASVSETEYALCFKDL
ncbi:DUF2971 domain-containing protein [Vibrio parahaemolyticus]|nr:DUF2971 domain-containing protein [Vibrio parahaemolyticus]ELA7501150.1 DUF2971 domain-containing protein [Vibrio parahaemolyticus]ELA7676351.1 DUF2971 domain-containing protein [Vibrio parahaemolyticus]